MPAKSQVRRLNAFTLVELLVVIGIISVLIAILMPALNRARQAAYSAACMSNLRQIGIAMTMYANDFNGFYPAAQTVAGNPSVTGISWDDAIYPYLAPNGGRMRATWPSGNWYDNYPGPKYYLPVLQCPFDPGPQSKGRNGNIDFLSYTMNVGQNGWGVENGNRGATDSSGTLFDYSAWRLPRNIRYVVSYDDTMALNDPSREVLILDNHWWRRQSEGAWMNTQEYYDGINWWSYHPNEGVNALYFDGHCESLAHKELTNSTSNTAVDYMITGPRPWWN